MKLESEPFVIDPVEALQFAKELDPNPSHLSGKSNGILPENTVSGLYVLSIANRILLKFPQYSGVLCATHLDVRWRNPIFSGDILFLQVQWEEEEDRNRPSIYRRKTLGKVLGYSTKTQNTNQGKMEFTIHQLIKREHS